MVIQSDMIYPLVAEQPVIDLYYGVNVNYPQFGAALKKIIGLESPCLP